MDLILLFTFLLNPNGHKFCCLHLHRGGWEGTSNTFPSTFLPGEDAANIGVKNSVRFFAADYGQLRTHQSCFKELTVIK